LLSVVRRIPSAEEVEEGVVCRCGRSQGLLSRVLPTGLMVLACHHRSV
jgi:hypothetical protein